MVHSVRFRIKKAHEAFMRQNPQFLGYSDRNIGKYAHLFRPFAIEQGVSEADIDKYINRRLQGEARAAQAEREGTGPGARLLRAMFTDPTALKPKRLLVIADDERHLADAKAALQALEYEVIGQLCNDLDRCSSCGSPKTACVCSPAGIMEYIHDTGLRP